MAECRSKVHQRYREALEGLYIQTWMAHRDLTAVLGDEELVSRADSRAKGEVLTQKLHKVDEVIERLNFGKSELAEAEKALNRHFDSGRCTVLRDIDARLAVR
jgi:hypothetical protein